MSVSGDGRLDVVSVPVDVSQATVQLRGELDIANVGLVEEVLDAHLVARRGSVRLDLSRLTFMDCTGVTLLVVTHQRFLDAGGALMLTGVTGLVERLLSVTGLDRVLLLAQEQPRGVVGGPLRTGDSTAHLRRVTAARARGARRA